MIKNSNFVKLLFALTVAAIVCFALAGPALPWILRAYFDYIGLSGNNITGMLVLLYIAYVPFMIIWSAVFRLCRNLMTDRPFCESSLRNLKIIGRCGMADFLVFLIGTVMFGRAVFFILAGAALMIGIISAVIRELVVRGIALSEDVELTV
jgi:hypothetical protein